MKLVFASNNEHKVSEISKIVPAGIEVVSLVAIGCNDDIPETADTLEGNALLKAQYVYQKYGVSCFADDTGLEVQALNNEPGVYSARYAGPQRNSNDNMRKLLADMSVINDRTARFRTVVALIIDGKEYLFEGIVDGTILKEGRGTDGFGYDPIFMPKGYDLSFAEMSIETKNQISHRGKAVSRLVEFLISI